MPARSGVTPSIRAFTTRARAPFKATSMRDETTGTSRTPATIYIVSRHPGAIEWMRRTLAAPDAVPLDHVAGRRFGPGDVVAGVLPLWLAARACADGARVFALDVDLAPGQRLSFSRVSEEKI